MCLEPCASDAPSRLFISFSWVSGRGAAAWADSVSWHRFDRGACWDFSLPRVTWYPPYILIHACPDARNHSVLRSRNGTSPSPESWRSPHHFGSVGSSVAIPPLLCSAPSGPLFIRNVCRVLPMCWAICKGLSLDLPPVSPPPPPREKALVVVFIPLPGMVNSLVQTLTALSAKE